jgi:hypothetical protein
VSTWRVILATLVIFVTGLLAGGALVYKFGPRPVAESDAPPFLPWEVKQEFVRRLVKDLELRPDQQEKIAQIVNESQNRIKILFELVGPEMREEMRQVRDSIRSVLTPEQKLKFDELRKHRRGRQNGRGAEGRRSRTSSSNSIPTRESSAPPAQTP